MQHGIPSALRDIVRHFVLVVFLFVLMNFVFQFQATNLLTNCSAYSNFNDSAYSNN